MDFSLEKPWNWKKDVHFTDQKVGKLAISTMIALNFEPKEHISVKFKTNI